MAVAAAMPALPLARCLAPVRLVSRACSSPTENSLLAPGTKELQGLRTDDGTRGKKMLHDAGGKLNVGTLSCMIYLSLKPEGNGSLG